VRLVAATAFAVRLAFCFLIFPYLAPHTTVGSQPYFDSYREIASSLVTGHGYRLGPDGPPALHRPPGYTLLIALCDPTDLARCHIFFKILHALLGALAAVLTIRAAEAWGIDGRHARWAGWLVALWPFLIWETKVTVPENVLVVLVPAAMLAVGHLRRGASLRWAVVAGATAAYAALSHGVYPAFAIAILVAIAAMGRWKAALVAALIIAIPLVAWTMRNAGLGYRGLATGFGYHYFKGVYDFDLIASGWRNLRDHDVPSQEYVSRMVEQVGFPSMASNAARSDPAVNRWLDAQAVEHVLAHPGYTVVRVIGGMPLLWVRQQTPTRAAVNALLIAPLFVMAVIGLRRRRDLWPIAMTIVLMSAAIAFVTTDAIPMRYGLPMLPLLAILAVVGSGRLARSARRNGALTRR
jgi:hypothetical protein